MCQNLPAHRSLPYRPARRRSDFERHRVLPLPPARGASSGEGQQPRRGRREAAAGAAAWMPPSPPAGGHASSPLHAARAQREPVGSGDEQGTGSSSMSGSGGDDQIELGGSGWGTAVGEAADDQIALHQGERWWSWECCVVRAAGSSGGAWICTRRSRLHPLRLAEHRRRPPGPGLQRRRCRAPTLSTTPASTPPRRALCRSTMRTRSRRSGRARSRRSQVGRCCRRPARAAG